METRTEPRGQIITDNSKKPKRYTINFRLRDVSVTVGMDCTGMSRGTPNTHTFSMYSDNTPEVAWTDFFAKISKAPGRIL